VAERTRTYGWADPRETAALFAGLTGLEALRLWASGAAPAPPIGETLGMTRIEVEPGTVTFTAQPQEFHYNPVGVVHGGFVLTLLDSAMSCAHLTTLAADVLSMTLEMNTHFVRPLFASSGPVRCTGTVVHAGRSVGTSEARVLGDDGRLYAHGTATLMAVPAAGERQA
jgi:uncharacterized protein (TIGR00369 family)